MRERISARIEPELLERLRKLAEEQDRSISYIVQQLLNDASAATAKQKCSER